MNNFIGIYENVLSDKVCDDFIRFFYQAEAAGLVSTRQQRENVNQIVKQDTNTFISQGLDLLPYAQAEHFYNPFWEYVYKSYANQFSILHTLASHNLYDLKIQRTKVGEGYHVWHCETADRESGKRLLTFVAYLNDVDEGGETEFLYYPLRVKPKKGTVCLFPGSFTHTHRGNPPLTNTKYVITGWVEF